MIKLAFLWFIAGVVFIGLLVEPISENILVEKAIFGAITILAGIIYWAVLQVEYFLNRKWWAVGFLAFVGIARVGNFNEIISLEFFYYVNSLKVTTRFSRDNSEKYPLNLMKINLEQNKPEVIFRYRENKKPEVSEII